MSHIENAVEPAIFALRSTKTCERTSIADQNLKWAAWITRIADGDIAALDALYDDSSKVVFSLVYHILQDRDVAEELLVGIYKRVRQEAQTFRDTDLSSTIWLITLARNAAVDLFRSVPEARLYSLEERQRVVSLACGGLTKEQHLILQMTYLGGFTTVEVADMLGLSLEEVRGQIVRSMNGLRRSI